MCVCVCASIAKVSHCVKLLLLLPPLLLLMPTERLVSWLWAVIIVITAKYQLFFFPSSALVFLIFLLNVHFNLHDKCTMQKMSRLNVQLAVT